MHLLKYYGNMINTEQLKQMRDNTMVENLKEALSDSEDEMMGKRKTMKRL
jgi:hypothetical protein